MKIEDVEVNWDDAMNPFTYDVLQGSNMFDASKTAHNQRVAAVEAHKKQQAEVIALFERLDDKETINRVVAELRQKDFPASGGLYETNVLFSRIGDRKVREFFDIWWRLISLGSRRDQMSFTVAADAADVSISPIFGKTSAKNCRYFSKSNHLSVRGRFI